MASVRFTDVQARPTEFLDFTSLTLDEFQQLVPPFEAAFHAHLAAWRLDGQPRTARQCSVDKNSPLPTPEDRLLFLLTSLKTYAFQVVHGCLFGMVQSKAHQWIHVLLPALRTLGDAPTRSLTALAQRLGVSEATAYRPPPRPCCTGRMLERQVKGPHRQQCPAGVCAAHDPLSQCNLLRPRP